VIDKSDQHIKLMQGMAHPRRKFEEALTNDHDRAAQLWQIEKAFRISKTDLRIRPIYHRLKHRIEAHICISFAAYCIYIELDHILHKEKSELSITRACELTYNMYQLNLILQNLTNKNHSIEYGS
jgi:transposase